MLKRKETDTKLKRERRENWLLGKKYKIWKKRVTKMQKKWRTQSFLH